MRWIGVSDGGLIYGGDGSYGHAIWPEPSLALATIILKEDDRLGIPVTTNLHVAKLVFREDSFDPVTRVRRGRLYENPGSQPQSWRVEPHPAAIMEVRQVGPQSSLAKSIHGYRAWPAYIHLRDHQSTCLVVLGTQEAATTWRIVSIERTVSGEDLVTLRAQGALGLLPELALDRIPTDAREKAVQVIELLATAAYRAGPESVIDRARDAACWLIASWIAARDGDPNLRKLDLGEAARRLQDKSLIQNAASALQRLHSRAKPNEQERYQVRPIAEEDAEFALAAVGLIIRELKWAR